MDQASPIGITFDQPSRLRYARVAGAVYLLLIVLYMSGQFLIASVQDTSSLAPSWPAPSGPKGCTASAWCCRRSPPCAPSSWPMRCLP
ncbi:MAG: hypothetical protein ACLGI6_09480 [Gammaproteobacteria bacterium]